MWWADPSKPKHPRRLRRTDVRRLLPLRAVHDVELNRLPLGERAVAVADDGREVHEHVIAIGMGDEVVALFVAESFDCAVR